LNLHPQTHEGRPCLPALLLLDDTQSHAAPTNVIILFSDDLGYGDLDCYESPVIRTPNIDRMAAEGQRFTDFQSAAEFCTPSRTALKQHQDN
jgi:hypothetical protein